MMIKPREVFLKQLVFLIDVVVLILSFYSAYHFRATMNLSGWNYMPGSPLFEPLRPMDNYLWLLLILLPVWTGFLSFFGGYRQLRMKSYLRIVWTVFKACLLGLFSFGALLYLLKVQYVSRTLLGLVFFFSFCFLSLERAALMVCFHVVLKRGYFYRSVLIVGTGRRAQHFVQVVRSHSGWGLKVVGFLDEDPALVGKKLEGVEIIGTLSSLPRLLREKVIDEVIFVVPRGWMSQLEPAMLQCELMGVRATVAVDLFNMRLAKVEPADLDGIPLISFDTTPLDQWKLAMKRVLDVVVAGAGLMALSPLFLVIAGLIKLASPGPVFFRQTRCGLNGRRFMLYKFRSMIANAEAHREELLHLNEMSGPVFKVTNDPRITPFGRFLRKTSLDELPQLINVFKGEMSLVGPRPPIPSEVEQYEPWQRRRLSMRPGITGYWQVSGRNGIKDFNRWTQLDLEYIDRWSLKLDAEILLKTVPAVVMGKGAK